MTNYKHGSRPTIGVLAGWQVYEGNVLDSYLEPVLRGIQSAASKCGCNLFLSCGLYRAGGPVNPAWPQFSPDGDFVPVGPWNTDGLLVITPLISEHRSAYIKQLMREGHPIVFIGEEEGGPAVDIDNELGIHKAVFHLAEHGHKRIVFLARYEGDSEATPGAPRRLLAYRSALQDFGLELDPALIGYGLHSHDGGKSALRQIIQKGIPFSAVLASNDYSAFGAMEALREAGLRIPEDVAVMGFDNWPKSQIETPPLTSVHSPSFEVGYRAHEMLLDFIGNEKSSRQIVRIPPRLVIRQSCGCSLDNLHSSKGASLTSKAEHAGLLPAADTLLSETMYLEMQEARVLYNRLIQAFSASIQSGDWAGFHSEYEELLDKVIQAGDDLYIWRDVLAFLDENIYMIHDSDLRPEAQQMAEDALAQAFDAFSRITRNQHVRRSLQQRNEANQLGWMTSRLMGLLDETQILNAIKDYLPAIGIRGIHIALYQADHDNPVANAIISGESGDGQKHSVFHSQEFPPPELLVGNSALCLGILPLAILEKLAGFVVFDTNNLDPCAVIVRQLSSTFSSARLYHQALESRRTAEEADQMKSRFLSTVSHELRTPLNLIVGLSNLVLQEDETPETLPLPPSRRRDLEQIHTNAEHLGRLIRDVLDLATSQAGKLHLELEPLGLAEALQAALEAGEELTRQKGLEWKASIPENLPGVTGDRTRLSQVLLNLISNAVKFTEQGRIEVRVEAGKGEVLVSVRDTGLGIAAEEQEIIFDEFRQSERTTARGYGGMGLGLAISRRLVELHGGRIGVQSSGQEGAGSTFYFTIPVLAKPGLAHQSLGRKVILLARQASVSHLLQERLMEQGYEVEMLLVGEGESWVSEVVALLPGAVVVDGALAAEQGWEILKVLKDQPVTRQIPILFYNLSENNGRGALLELDYLMKPLARADLMQAISQQGLSPEENLGKTRTILVVDDEPGTLALHVRMVQSLSPGYQVLTARNGREALELIQSSLPNLVLLDLMMPEMDGFGVLDAMRVGETTREIPVVVLTAQVLTEADMARLNQGVVAVLGKDMFSLDETLAHLEQALGRRQKLGSETQRLVRKAMAYLHTHYAEPVAREALARHVGVDKDYLIRCFRRETGLTPFAYLQRYRINRAKVLLAAGEKSVEEVTEAVGFSDISYFSRVFQKEVKVSPGAYRRGQRSEINPPG